MILGLVLQVVHCDLAARNILICEGFVLKIGDFGLARSALDEEKYHSIIDVINPFFELCRVWQLVTCIGIKYNCLGGQNFNRHALSSQQPNNKQVSIIKAKLYNKPRTFLANESVSCFMLRLLNCCPLKYLLNIFLSHSLKMW